MAKNICGENIKRFRLLETPICTQADLSARLEVLGCKISVATISKMENGNREINDIQLLAFAKALKVTPMHLLDTSDSHISNIK